MKQTLLAFIITVTCLAPAFAQKGTWLWYGNLGGTNASSDAPIVDGVKMSINTMHGIGYQFHSRWGVGLQGSYGYAKSEVYNALGGINDLKNSNWTAGLFFRYTAGKRLYAFVQGDLGWAGSTQKVNDVEVGSSHGFGIGLTPTMGANLYRGWCLNLSFINISWNSNSPGNNVNTTNFTYNFFQNFVFGIQKIWGGHSTCDDHCFKPANPAPAPTPPMTK
jgi:hypothetical protein